MSKKIDFFVVGAQKAGTTALAAMLRDHPGVQFSSVKEAHFFDADHVDWNEPSTAELHRYFDWTAGRKIRGEATPIYIYWPNSLERLQRYNPEARLIVGLRHPIFRAHSQWKMEVKRGSDNLSFSDAIRVGRQRVRQAPGGVHRNYSYVERGFYADQIAALKQLFPPHQVLYFRTDQLWQNTAHELARIESFLGLDHVLQPVRSYIAPLPPTRDEPIAPADRAYLADLFHESILRLATLLDHDFSDWLDPEHEEPMTPPFLAG